MHKYIYYKHVYYNLFKEILKNIIFRNQGNTFKSNATPKSVSLCFESRHYVRGKENLNYTQIVYEFSYDQPNRYVSTSIYINII